MRIFGLRPMLRAACCIGSRASGLGENAVNEVISAKVFCTELVGRVVDTAVQLVGGSALVTGHPL